MHLSGILYAVDIALNTRKTQMEILLIIPECPYCIRVCMLLLAHKLQVPCIYRSDFPDPKFHHTQVPCLIKENGSYLLESLDICKYFDENINTTPPKDLDTVQELINVMKIQKTRGNYEIGYLVGELEKNLKIGDLSYDIFMWPILRKVDINTVVEACYCPNILKYFEYASKVYDIPMKQQLKSKISPSNQL